MIPKDALRKLIIASIIIVGASLLAYSLRNEKDVITSDSPKAIPAEELKSLSENEPSLDIKGANSQYVLVNKSNPIAPIDFKPGDLVIPDIQTSSSDTEDERSIRKVVKSGLEKMVNDAKEDGQELVMNSGFRSYKAQSFYFNNYVRQSGLEEAKKFSAQPGYSEHQTGLAFDLSYKDKKCYLEVCFGETEAGKWLATNAHKYGFVIRYPKGKEGITGYQYEPWHFRYVGEEVAKDMHEQNLTYEEFLRDKGLITL